MYFCHIKNVAYGEINERSFSNPHPRSSREATNFGFRLFHLGSSAAEMPAKFRSDTMIVTSNLVASELHEILL